MKQEEINNQLIDIAESLLDKSHVVSFRMQGNSMFPALKEGDLGRVEKCNPNDLKIGDIVVFKINEKLIAHRLIEIFYQKGIRVFVAKGDKNYHKDAPFTGDELIGKITSFQRKNRVRKSEGVIMKVQQFISIYFSNAVIPFYDIRFKYRYHVNSLKSRFQSLKDNISVISKGSEKLLGINFVIAIFQGIVPFAIILFIKLLIDQLTKSSSVGSSHNLYFIVLLIITGLIFLLSAILSEINSFYSEKLSQSVTRHIYGKLHSKHVLLDLSNYENSEKQDKIHRAVQESSYRPIKILNELQLGVKSIASALFLVGLFISIRWYLVLILFVAILPGILIRLRYSKKLYKLKESQSTKEREMYYYNRILTGFPFAKELKLFNFFDFFRNRFIVVQDTLFDQKISLQKTELQKGIYAQIFAIILIFISLGFVSWLKITGEISIGTVVLFFFAFQRGYSVLNDFFRSITQIIEDNTFLKDFIEFLNIPTRINNQTIANSTFSLNKEIRFENVSFRYETSKRDALKSININIPSGKTVAFVGANGSGKTTMIKLICGLYQPDSGNIFFDGVDSTAIGQQTICENISAVFQDFALYNIAALENIGLGNTQIPVNLEKARDAAQSAGIDQIIKQLPDGYDTLLGNLFKTGEELSIGQWQKIAIARAFYRDSQLILMDEPSSALDADSELQIIDSLKKLSHDKTTVIVSHRLSTVQWVDKIYFFHEGEVLESGNHKELMALKGKYYSLFQTVNNPS